MAQPASPALMERMGLTEQRAQLVSRVLMARRAQLAPVENKESRERPGLLAQLELLEQRVLMEFKEWPVLMV
jgi:hypothetical protein